MLIIYWLLVAVFSKVSEKNDRVEKKTGQILRRNERKQEEPAISEMCKHGEDNCFSNRNNEKIKLKTTLSKKKFKTQICNKNEIKIVAIMLTV